MSRQLCRTALHALICVHFLSVRSLSPVEQFARVWSRLHRSRLARLLAAGYAHRCQLDPRELIMALCFGFTLRKDPDFTVPLRIERMPAELKQTSPPLGAICISTHAGHASAATALLELGHPSCLLVDAAPNASGQALHSWLRERHPDLKLIPNDRLSLARVVRELEGGRSVCCAVDYQDPRRKLYCYISPMLFELARRTGRPMYFGRPGIDPAGNAILDVEGPHFVTDPLASTQRFIEFINEGRQTPRALSIGPH